MIGIWTPIRSAGAPCLVFQDCAVRCSAATSTSLIVVPEACSASSDSSNMVDESDAGGSDDGYGTANFS